METASQISWRRVIVEGLVIVASILLAFAIDAAWDGRQERHREREVLLALEQVMVDTEGEVDRVLGREETGRAAFDAFIESTAEQLGVLSQDSAVAVLGPLVTHATLSPLNGIVLNGQLSQLRDPRLLRVLGTWSAVVGDIVDLAPSLMDNIRGVRMSMGAHALEYRYGPAGLDADSAPEILAALRRSEAFLTARITAQVTKEANWEKVLRLRELTAEARVLLQEGLSGGAF